MKNAFEITRSEFVHFIRSPLKVISLMLYVLALVYGCQNGFNLFKTHRSEIMAIKAKNGNSITKMILQYEEIENGLKEKPRRDPTTPYWAIWNTPSYAFKKPSPMMVFSIGQSEQYGYYKRVTNWSSTFDNDLAEEIANPERLAIGTLDFNFVFIYLTPILFIIMLFNIGGLEKDLRFDNIIYLNNISKEKWLFSRFLFYFMILIISLFSLMLLYAFISGVFPNETFNFIKLMITVSIYILFWLVIYYLINLYGIGSSDQALKMISIWLILCIIIPGTVHQFSSIKYPNNYMTDYLDVSRDQSNDIFELSSDTLQIRLLSEFPNIQNTIYASDTSMDEGIINRSISGLVNILNKNVSRSIERSNDKKNEFIKSFYLLNPVIFFQNKINGITSTDYYAYKDYRKHIQNIIDKKINLILVDTWNKVRVDKEKFIGYVENFK